MFSDCSSVKPVCLSCDKELEDWPYLWPDPHCQHCGISLPFVAREVLQEVLRKHNISHSSVENFFRILSNTQVSDHFHTQRKH